MRSPSVAIKKAVRNPRQVYNLLKDNIRFYYWRKTNNSYTEAYREYMKLTIKNAGHSDAVGGWGTGIGKLQFEFLKERGLEPHHSLLDIGCGSLRGGRYFIDYLSEDNYTGMDISAEAIEAGKEQVDPSLLSENNPTFHVNDNLRFEEVADQDFDFALAQSVFTHLPESDVRECLNHIERAIGDDGVFYATFNGEDNRMKGVLSDRIFYYSYDKLRKMADDSGLAIEIFDAEDYPHPRGQRMFRVRVK